MIFALGWHRPLCIQRNNMNTYLNCLINRKPYNILLNTNIMAHCNHHRPAEHPGTSLRIEIVHNNLIFTETCIDCGEVIEIILNIGGPEMGTLASSLPFNWRSKLD